MRIHYNKTLIFYIKTLKIQKIITTWDEGARIYYQFEKKNISPTNLQAQTKNIDLATDVDMYAFYDYCKKTDLFIKTEDEDIEVNQGTEIIDFDCPMVRALQIPKDDLEPVFDVCLDLDSVDVIKQKIRSKISNESFLLTYMGFDPGTFEVKNIEMGSWTTPVKLKTAKEDKLKIVQNEKFLITIKKRANKILYYTKEECDKWLKDFIEKKLLTPYDFFEDSHNDKEFEYNDNLLMVCPGLELHLGKLASIADYEDYSTKQGMWRIKKVAYEIVKYQELYKAGALLLGVGNDYYNSDTTDDKTTAGTPQDNDTRFKEVYLWGKVGYIRMIETLKHYFDTIVLKGNPGNHDEKASFSLFTNICDLYSLTRDPKIKVSFSYQDMRFSTCFPYGKNLIVFSHGKNSEGKNLSDKLIAESVKNLFPEEARKAASIYVFVGHLHQDSEQKFDNVTVIRTASLSGIDNWTYSNLYLGQREGHSIYLIDKELGYIGKKLITLSTSEKQMKIPGISRDEQTDVYSAMTGKLKLDDEDYMVRSKEERLRILTQREKNEQLKYDRIIHDLLAALKIDSQLSAENLKELRRILGYNTKTASVEHEKKLILNILNERKGK